MDPDYTPPPRRDSFLALSEHRQAQRLAPLRVAVGSLADDELNAVCELPACFFKPEVLDLLLSESASRRVAGRSPF